MKNLSEQEMQILTKLKQEPLHAQSMKNMNPEIIEKLLLNNLVIISFDDLMLTSAGHRAIDTKFFY